MTELHMDLNSFSLEKALHYASLAKIKYLGVITDDLTLSKEKIQEIKEIGNTLSLFHNIEFFLGVKLSFIPPALIVEYTEKLRVKGFDYIGVHGENIHQPVASGTNLAALNANVDILFHAGIVDEALLEYAQEKNTKFEFNLHPFYSSANALLAYYNKKYNFSLIWGNTIKKEKDFIYSLKKKENLALYPQISSSFDLMKKINQDTFNYVQELMKTKNKSFTKDILV